MLRRFPLLALAAALLAAPPATAADPWQNHAQIADAARRFAEDGTRNLPGEVTVTAGAIDPRLRLAACARLEAFLPTGGRLWGSSTVGVRCGAPTAWTLYVPLTVNVIGDAVLSARALSPGQVIGDGDIEVRRMDLTQLPPGVFSDARQVIGKALAQGVTASQPLRHEQLRVAPAIRQGQAVRLVAQGKGFSVSSEGKALGNAAEGQVVQVRTGNGQVLKGIARVGGVVEVGF